MACHVAHVHSCSIDFVNTQVVLDLGRRPEARFLGVPAGEFLREAEVSAEDLAAAVTAVGEFGGDNRAGVAGTLHRISALRNRRGAVIGLTCRVGRAVSGHTDMLRDLVESEYRGSCCVPRMMCAGIHTRPLAMSAETLSSSCTLRLAPSIT